MSNKVSKNGIEALKNHKTANILVFGLGPLNSPSIFLLYKLLRDTSVKLEKYKGKNRRQIKYIKRYRLLVNKSDIYFFYFHFYAITRPHISTEKTIVQCKNIDLN